MGEDGIPNELLKNGGPQMVEALQLLFRTCQRQNWTPIGWNNELLKLIPKKERKSVLDNQRGISLTSNIGKVFARMMATQLLLEVEYRGWLPESQAGS